MHPFSRDDVHSFLLFDFDVISIPISIFWFCRALLLLDWQNISTMNFFKRNIDSWRICEDKHTRMSCRYFFASLQIKLATPNLVFNVANSDSS